MTLCWDHFTEFIYKVMENNIPERGVAQSSGRNSKDCKSTSIEKQNKTYFFTKGT